MLKNFIEIYDFIKKIDNREKISRKEYDKYYYRAVAEIIANEIAIDSRLGAFIKSKLKTSWMATAEHYCVPSMDSYFVELNPALEPVQVNYVRKVASSVYELLGYQLCDNFRDDFQTEHGSQGEKLHEEYKEEFWRLIKGGEDDK